MLNQAYSASCWPLNVALRGLPVRIRPGMTVVTTMPSFGSSARSPSDRPDQRELAAAVRQQVGHAHLAADRRDVDDAALRGAASSPAGRRGWRAAAPRSGSASPPRSPRSVISSIGADLDDAGVVDQHVQRPKWPIDPLHHRLDLRRGRGRRTGCAQHVRAKLVAGAAPARPRRGRRSPAACPRRPARRAITSPSPREPPVISATRPVRSSDRVSRNSVRAARQAPRPAAAHRSGVLGVVVHGGPLAGGATPPGLPGADEAIREARPAGGSGLEHDLDAVVLLVAEDAGTPPARLAAAAGA